MSQDLEKNKIFASILVAGIVAMLCGFIASLLVHPERPEKTAIEIDTSAVESAAGGADAGPKGPEPILALLATADAKKGEALGKACLACHTFRDGEANKVGPNLYGIVNNHKAHKGDFAYSDAIKAQAAKGETWTYANLNHFLYKPSAYVPGTKMTFPGLKKPQDRADVIAYLRTLAGSPAPLPSAAEIAAEAPETKDVKDAPKADAKESDKKDATGTAKANADESQASDAQKAVTEEKAKPVQNAAQNNQALGEEPAPGATNPTPAVGQ